MGDMDREPTPSVRQHSMRSLRERNRKDGSSTLRAAAIRYSERARPNASKNMQDYASPAANSTECHTRDDLVTAHLHLVRSIAGRVRSGPTGRGVALEDLVAYGAIGLLEAASRFDATKGVPFAGFAGRRIHGAIVDGIRLHHWFGRGADRRLGVERAGEGWLVELADAGQACNDTRWNSRPLIQPPVEPDDTLQSLVASELQRLPARQRRLLDLHHNQGKTLSAAAREMGFGPSWASRMHAGAIATLRAAAKRHASPPHRHSQPRNQKHLGDPVPTNRRVIAKRNGSS